LGAKGILLDTNIGPDVPDVFIDRIQIQQVMVNLVRNAVEAVGGQDRPIIRIEARCEGDNYVLISVCDNGAGISSEIKDRLFEPFATSKQEGMGMGLSICRTIVEAHGGRIWVESGKGETTFSFRIPVAAVPP
jgi:two-component system sensor kinase FixL